MGIYKDIKNLVIGLQITGKHLGRHAITIQYPEERWTMPERSRGIVVLLSDKETGELNCTACELCQRACPSAAITIESHRDDKKKRHLDEFTIDFGLCCFCGLCEEACNFSALKMATKYEFSVLDKEDLIWKKDKLQAVGLDVDYIDTRKKKKPKPAAEAGSIPVADKAKADAAGTKDGETNKPVEEKPQTATDAAAPPHKVETGGEKKTASAVPTEPAEDKPDVKAESEEGKKDGTDRQTEGGAT